MIESGPQECPTYGHLHPLHGAVCYLAMGLGITRSYPLMAGTDQQQIRQDRNAKMDDRLTDFVNTFFLTIASLTCLLLVMYGCGTTGQESTRNTAPVGLSQATDSNAQLRSHTPGIRSTFCPPIVSRHAANKIKMIKSANVQDSLAAITHSLSRYYFTSRRRYLYTCKESIPGSPYSTSDYQ